MNSRSRTELKVNPTAEDARWLVDRLREFNRSRVENAVRLSFLITLLDSGDNVVGGLFAQISYTWLFVDILWISDEVRGRGEGRNLLRRAEEEARRRDCVGAWVDTFSFQARGFYEKNGYTIFGELPD